MPIINVYWSKKETAEGKKELMEFIAQSVHKATATPVENIYVYINELEAENMRIDAPVFDIRWAVTPARTPEAKKIIVAEVSQKLQELTGVEIGKIVATISDLPLTNVGLGGVTRG